MIDYPKVVFTKTLNNSTWENTVLATGDITEEVNKLKGQEGKDIIVYGGAGFDASLIKAGLIDDLFLFINPAAIGNGLSIFKEISSTQKLKLIEALPFDCGIVVLHYELQRN